MMILLDMDGVVTDAHAAFLAAMGREDMIGKYPPGEFHVNKIVGVSEEDMWKKVDAAGEDLWSYMDTLPWARDLYRGLCGRFGCDKVVFCTAPSWSPTSCSGKLRWLQSFTGKKDFRNYVLTSRKDLLAKVGSILIDDYPKNCESFREAGGQAIEFPCKWKGDSPDAVWSFVKNLISGFGWTK